MRSAKEFLPLLAAVLLLLIVFRAWVPQFLAAENLLDLAQQISVNAMLAFGMTLVILIGGIDLSVGAVVALTGTVAAATMAHGGAAAGIVAALAVAVLIGTVNGMCAARTRMPPFIITLAM